MATYTFRDVLAIVREATQILAPKSIKMTTIDKEGEDGPELNGTMGDYILWSVAAEMGVDDSTKGTLKEMVSDFAEEIDAGYKPAGIITTRFGRARKTQRNKKSLNRRRR